MKRVIILIMAIISILLLVTDLVAENNFMWQVEKQGNQLYLLGSIHLMPDSIYPLPEIMVNKFKEADYLVVEADPGKLDQQEIQQLIMEKGFYPEGKTLKGEIAPELYEKLTEIFANFGIPIAQIERYKPWFVSLNLGVMEMQKLGMKAENGIDLHFLNLAKAEGKEVLELESGLEQMEILTSFPEAEQEEYLAYSVNNYESAAELLNQMLSAWLQGDADLMNQATKEEFAKFMEEFPGLEGFYNKIFYERDVKMVEKIVEYLSGKEEKTYFIVVGSGHLIGKDGILEQLQKLGYQPEQL